MLSINLKVNKGADDDATGVRLPLSILDHDFVAFGVLAVDLFALVLQVEANKGNEHCQISSSVQLD